METQDLAAFLTILTTLFDHHPQAEGFYFTADGLAFFTEQEALNQVTALEDKNINHITREQFETAKLQHAAGLFDAPKAEGQENSGTNDGGTAGATGGPEGTDSGDGKAGATAEATATGLVGGPAVEQIKGDKAAAEKKTTKKK